MRPTIFYVFTSALLCAPALADQVQVTNTDAFYTVDFQRFALGSPNIDELDFHSINAPNNFAQWDVDTTRVFQTASVGVMHHSSILDTSFSVDLQLDATANPGNHFYEIYAIDAYNWIDIDFEVTSTIDYNLKAGMAASNTTDLGLATTELKIHSTDTGTFEYAQSVNAGSSTIDESFTLTPGTYRFSVHATTILGGFGEMDPGQLLAAFNGTLSVAPSPTTLAIAPIGIAIMTRRRRT